MKSRHRRNLLRLQIDPLIEQASAIAERVRVELPNHSGLLRVSAGVVDAASEAKRIAASLRRPWGLHRLPAAFLAVSLLLLAAWVYWNFFHVSRLTIAVPERDAIELRRKLSRNQRVHFIVRSTQGSTEDAKLVADGEVDLAFVQGGIEIQPNLPRLEAGQSESVLYFVRDRIERPEQLRRVLTSVPDQGSHSVAKDFLRLWRIGAQVEFVHEWDRLIEDADYAVPPDVDGVFVVKDLSSEKTLLAAQRLADAGFQLASPNLGARALTLEYLHPVEIAPSFLVSEPPMPAKQVTTYTVATYVVARRGLTPRVMAAAAHLMDNEIEANWQPGFEPTLSDAGELLQAVEAFLSILVFVGLAFLTLLGIEVISYRKRFHELNTLISLISIHQSNKDVLGLTDDEERRNNLLYLSICSDLLGLISVISGYYTQENSSLLYSNLLEIIHHRTSGLKLNIQTKILHAAIR